MIAAMRMPLSIALVASLVACKGEPFLPDARIDAAIDAFNPTWITPEPGELSNWDIQLAAPFDVSAARDMYMLDLWAVAPATTIMYSDGSTVTVEAGPLASMVAALKTRSKLFCHVRTGSVRVQTDPDAMKFPGWSATPPNNPDRPTSGSVIGWRVSGGFADEHYLDVRARSRDVLRELVGKRIELADQVGCDAVVMDRNDRFVADDGWDITPGEDEESWHLETAAMAHALDMGAGTKNSYLRGQLAALVGPYDFGVVVGCAEFDECMMLRPYLNLIEAVYAYEHAYDEQEQTGILPENACRIHGEDGIQDGLAKNSGVPNATFTQPCNP